jgi:hypothetical protein
MPQIPLAVEWYEYVGGVLGIPAALMTIYGGWVLSEKTRTETSVKRLERLKLERELGAESPSHVHRGELSSEATVLEPLETEGYIVRFLILYLVLVGWGALASIIAAFVGSLIDPRFFQYFETLVRVLIFLLIGLPLLKDVARRFGLRPREVFRARLRGLIVAASNSARALQQRRRRARNCVRPAYFRCARRLGAELGGGGIDVGRCKRC